jgi:hypothetical protein
MGPMLVDFCSEEAGVGADVDVGDSDDGLDELEVSGVDVYVLDDIG